MKLACTSVSANAKSNGTDIALVIDRTASIENMLNQVIEKFCSPRKEVFTFFWGVVLDSSIMTMGAKVKVAMAISQELNTKVNQKALHAVVALRNAFAHHSVNSHPTMSVGKTPEENKSYYARQIISHSGKVSRKTRKSALEDFDIAYKAAKKSLTELLLAIDKK